MPETEPPEKPTEDTGAAGDAETSEERAARRAETAAEIIANTTPEEWDEIRRQVREEEEKRTKEIFGDKPPTIYIDTYDDL